MVRNSLAISNLMLTSADTDVEQTALTTAGILDAEVHAALLKLAGGGRSRFMTRLVDAFAASWKEDIEALRGAIEVADFEQAQRTAHRMKSASANLGAASLREICGNVESAASLGEREQLQSGLTELHELYAVTVDALRRSASADGNEQAS